VIALLWVHFTCSPGTLARKKTTSPLPSATEPARACRATVRRATDTQQGSLLGRRELRTRGAVGPARRGELRRRVHPPTCSHETGPQTRPHDWPKRCVSGDGERNREDSAGALGGFKLKAVWTKPQTKCARTAGRSAGGCERVTFACKFGVTQTRQHWSVGVGRHTCTGTMSLTDRHIKSTPGDIPF